MVLYNLLFMQYQLIQIFYWLSLSTWFGGALFIALVAPVIFHTIREFNPTLPSVHGTTLQSQHATLLAGAIIGRMLTKLRQIQVVCAAILLITLILQWLLMDYDARSITYASARSALYLLAIVTLILDYFWITPKIRESRQQYIDHADEPEIANPARDRFDTYHHRSVLLLGIQLFLLLGLILFSVNVVYVTTLPSL